MPDDTVTLWILRQRASGAMELWQNGEPLDQMDWPASFDAALLNLTATNAMLRGQLEEMIANGSGRTTTLTAQANSGQPVLQVQDVTDFAVGDSVFVGSSGGPNEARIIQSIAAPNITLTANLTNTYAIGKPVSRSPVELFEARGSERSLNARLNVIARGFINVKDAAYGALGDGTTDDTAAIQAAINAATAGQVVYLPPGTYKISATLLISDMITLAGAGGWSGATVINQITANTTAVHFDANGDHSLAIGLKITGPGGAPTTSAGLLLAKSVHCEDIEVSGFYDGVRLSSSGTYYAELNRVFAHNNINAGIYFLTGSYNATLTHCRAQANAFGIVAISHTSLRIVGGSIEQNTTRGIEANGTVSRAFSCVGVYFESAVGSDDIRLGAASSLEGALIQGCRFADNSVAGYFHIDCYVVKALVIMGCDFGAAGAGGGSVRTASTTGDVTLLNNDMPADTSIHADTKLVQIDPLGVRTQGLVHASVPSALQTLVAASNLVANAENIEISAASPITLTSVPTIASGIDGQRLVVFNAGANAITFQDQGTLAGSNLRLTAATVALGTRDTLILRYRATVGDWVQENTPPNVI